MPKYILHYFNVESRGEASRIMFKLAGVDFEDRRIPFSEWPEHKGRFTLKQVPVLEVDGVCIGQSKAILRYLAREFGFYGSTSLEGAFIDEVMDTADDAWFPVSGIFLSKGDQKQSLLKTYKEEQLPAVFGRLECLFALDRAGDFFIGNSITAADIFFFTLAQTVDIYVQCDVLEKFPKLSALKKRIASNPVISGWLNERPKPEFVVDLSKDLSK